MCGINLGAFSDQKPDSIVDVNVSPHNYIIIIREFYWLCMDSPYILSQWKKKEKGPSMMSLLG